LAQAQLVNATPEIASDDCYNLGCLHALAAAAVRKDPSVSPVERDRLVDSHITGAMRWLKSAAEAGLFHDSAMRVHAKKDTDLEILRDRPEFLRLLDAPEDKSTKKGKGK
jgi:hypothetical protein